MALIYLIDSADLKAIYECMDTYPVDGVTTNPTIVGRENADFCELMKTIRRIITPERMLHVQVTALDFKSIVEEGLALNEFLGGELYVKIPISPDGLKATAVLKTKGIKVTETAIFTQQQALLAAKAGADFVAPYVNRLDNIVSDGVHVTEEIVGLFNLHSIKSKVLAASFKNIEQVHKTSMIGCHAVTIAPEMFGALASHPLTAAAIRSFGEDWQKVYGAETVGSLLKKRKEDI